MITIDHDVLLLYANTVFELPINKIVKMEIGLRNSLSVWLQTYICK